MSDGVKVYEGAMVKSISDGEEVALLASTPLGGAGEAITGRTCTRTCSSLLVEPPSCVSASTCKGADGLNALDAVCFGFQDDECKQGAGTYVVEAAASK